MCSSSVNFFRPVLLEFLVLMQWVMWYRLPKPGREGEAMQHGPMVPVVTAGDLPAPPGQAFLPLSITLQDGRVMRRRRQPVAVEWGPSSNFEDLLMLKVIAYLK